MANGAISLSLAGIAGTISFSLRSWLGLTPSFLPKRLPKTDPLLVGFGATSAAMAEDGSAPLGSPVTGVARSSPLEASLEITGSRMTRAAVVPHISLQT